MQSPESADSENIPVPLLRREWKRSKPHLQKSGSLPPSSFPPSSRPLFTCQRCGFANSQAPMCLWCCWTSSEAEAEFHDSMPKAKRASAPMQAPTRVCDHANGSSNGNRKSRAEIRSNAKPATGRLNAETIDPGISNRKKSNYRNRHGTSASAPTIGQAGAWNFGGLGKKRSAGQFKRGLMDAIGNVGSALAAHGRRRTQDSSLVVVKDQIRHVNVRPNNNNSVQASLPSGTFPATSRAATNGKVRDRDFAREDQPFKPRWYKRPFPPLYIEPQVPSHRDHGIESAASSNPPTTTSKPPLAPAVLRQLRQLGSRWSRSRLPDHGNEGVADSQTVPPSITRGAQRSGSAPPSLRLPISVTPTSRVPGARRASEAACSTNQNYPRPSMPENPNWKWSETDPFGEVLGLRETAPISTPGTPSTVQVTLTPTLRRSTSTMSYLDSSAPTSPTSSVRSEKGIAGRDKPLYSVIRKNGFYHSPPSSPPVSPSRSTFVPERPEILPGGRINDSASNRDVNSPLQVLSHHPSHSAPTSPQPSPISRLFPVYPLSGDGNLASLTIDSRPCTGSTSSHGDHTPTPFSISDACRKTASQVKSRRFAKSSSDGSIKAKKSTGTMNPGGVAMAPLRQQVSQSPLDVVRGTGYSMSGEVELKLALAGEKQRLPGDPTPAVSKYSAPYLRPRSRSSPNLRSSFRTEPPSPIGKLRKMVSKMLHG